MKSLPLILVILLSSVAQLAAWSGPGHITVAAIAYRELSPAERQKATELLKNHYEYAKWKAEVPENEPALDEGIVAFMGASKWADEIKFGNSSLPPRIFAQRTSRVCLAARPRRREFSAGRLHHQTAGS